MLAMEVEEANLRKGETGQPRQAVLRYREFFFFFHINLWIFFFLQREIGKVFF